MDTVCSVFFPTLQPEHEGRTLNKIVNPDEIIDIKHDKCECGRSLADVEGTICSRQVIDMPKIKLQVTELRTCEKVCPDCKKVHKTEFPENITQPVQYGENMQAFMDYLINYQLLPLERTTELISDITGHKISESPSDSAACAIVYVSSLTSLARINA